MRFLHVNIYMEPVQLTVSDMKSLQNLLEAACARGTWKAAEMFTVGSVYNKLSAFITQAETQLASQQSQGE